LHELVSLKASMNLGLSEQFFFKKKMAFPSVVPKVRPLVVDKTIAVACALND